MFSKIVIFYINLRSRNASKDHAIQTELLGYFSVKNMHVPDITLSVNRTRLITQDSGSTVKKARDILLTNISVSI